MHKPLRPLFCDLATAMQIQPVTFTLMHLAVALIQSNLLKRNKAIHQRISDIRNTKWIYIYIYAFSRRFYPYLFRL